MSSDKLSYEELSDAARFREQHRLLFSGIIIATVFVVQSDNILETFLKIVLIFSAIFAGLYIILSAATLKYREPRWMYDVLYASEGFRKKMYDWSVDVFAVGFIYFLGLIITGGIQATFKFKLGEGLALVVSVITMILAGLLLFFTSRFLKRRQDKLPNSNKSAI